MQLESHALAIRPGDGNSIVISAKRNPEQYIELAAPELQIDTNQGKKSFQGTIDPKSAGAISGKFAGHIHMSLLKNEYVNFELEIATRSHYSGILFRLHVTNLALDPFRVGQIGFGKSINLKTTADLSSDIDWGVYQNGWQSWSYSGTYSANMKPLLSKLKLFQGPKLYDAASPQMDKAGIFASDQFGVLLDRTNRIGILVGFLSQINHFGHILFKPGTAEAVNILASGDSTVITSGRTISSDWLTIDFLDLNDPDPLKHYLEEVARENQVKPNDVIPSGWCTWYQYFTKINPDIIRMNLDLLSELKDELPLDYLQIDDGYQTAVGDWMDTKHRFYAQMDLLADEIKEQGYKAGLWMAPFIVHPDSQIFKNHPDWLIKDEKGKVVNAGWNWNKFCAGLDLTHPEVQVYIRRIIENAVNAWGYTYLKLDFLYAGALEGKRYDPSMSRAQALRKGMEIIRDAAGEGTYLLGCGAPLGPMLGIVDGMRIGTDVAPDWEPKYFGIELLFPNEPDIPSVKNAMHNTITRSMMHQRWWQNDPDCLLVRESSNLTLAEVRTMASIIGMTGGLMLISDDMNKVTRYRLRIAQSLLPVIGLRPMLIDWADSEHPQMMRLDLSNRSDSWHVLSYTNWKNTTVRKELKLEDYKLSSEGNWYLRSFWDEKLIEVSKGKFELVIPPHGTVLMSARKIHPGKPSYLGSNLHISQGLELARFEVNNDSLTMELNRPMIMKGSYDLYLQQEPKKVIAGKKRIDFRLLQNNIYRFDVNIDKFQDIQIDW